MQRLEVVNGVNGISQRISLCQANPTHPERSVFKANSTVDPTPRILHINQTHTTVYSMQIMRKFLVLELLNE